LVKELQDLKSAMITTAASNKKATAVFLIIIEIKSVVTPCFQKS